MRLAAVGRHAVHDVQAQAEVEAVAAARVSNEERVQEGSMSEHLTPDPRLDAAIDGRTLGWLVANSADRTGWTPAQVAAEKAYGIARLNEKVG